MISSTPLLDQYFRLKAEAEDSLLLFRVGDFYEAYGEDAKLLSRALEIVLTGREVRGTKIPMAGVPHHTLDHHLKTLLKGGYKVAVCEQLEEASDARKLIPRDIVRYLTPGTLLEPELLEEKEPNYLLAVAAENGAWGLSWCDVSTGAWSVAVLPADREILFQEILKLSPKEILLPRDFSLAAGIEKRFSAKISREISGPAESGVNLPGGVPPEAQGASRRLLAYLSKIYRGNLPELSPPQVVQTRRFMVLDSAAARNLELFGTLSGGKEGSLLHLLDQTQTPMGARLLRQWMMRPLLDKNEIERRQEGVNELCGASKIRGEIRKRLSGLGDLERLAARIAFRTAHARDLLSVKLVLKEVPGIRGLLKDFRSPVLAEWVSEVPDLSQVHDLLERALDENPPAGLKEGGLIRRGYHADLDRRSRELEQALDWIARLEETERAATGIKSLKVGYNQVFGYYLEVTRPHLSAVPSRYIRKQTLANAERFIIEPLKIREAEILGSREKSQKLEYEIFCGIREEVNARCADLRRCAELLARLDVLASLALVAEQRNYCRPEMHEGDLLFIQAGRHPVVESAGLGTFVPNDCRLDGGENRFIVLTGPNMAGKSTYLRQTALCAILAQMGSFVPAKAAKLGIVDRVFTRIGAADDLHRGESTFFVEMREVAEILKEATPRSLVLLDEVGRGTSTFDGLSLAWAAAEELLARGAKALFATHYHEMTALAARAKGVKNFTTAVAEKGDDVIFLRRIVPGAADKSYGIHVARLAGVALHVVERAKKVLRDLENRGLEGDAPCHSERSEESPGRSEGSVSRQKAAPPLRPGDSPAFGLGMTLSSEILRALDAVDVHNLTGLEALNLLASWKERFGGT